MPPQKDRTTELEQEIVRLMKEVDRYRTAAEDALQQLDWCIGYFAGAHKAQVARALSANRAHIRQEFLRRSAQSVSAPEDGRS